MASLGPDIFATHAIIKRFFQVNAFLGVRALIVHPPIWFLAKLILRTLPNFFAPTTAS